MFTWAAPIARNGVWGIRDPTERRALEFCRVARFCFANRVDVKRYGRNPMLHRNLILLAVTATLSLAGCQKQAAIAPEPPRPVKMAIVPATTNFRTLILSGTIKSRIESNLSFRVSGKILERKVDIGQRVRSGDVLARIDTIDLKLGLRTANAGVDGAKARLRVAQDEFNRYQSLFDHGIVAQSALDRTKLEADQAEAALNQAIAMREQSANQTNYAELTADAPGIVTAIAAEAGQVVSPGTPVVTVSREDEMEAAINVPEQEIRYFSENMPVDVTY